MNVRARDPDVVIQMAGRARVVRMSVGGGTIWEKNEYVKEIRTTK